MKAALLTLWRSLARTYRRGFALFALAPLAVALVVVPEFVQHVVEIRIGMFDSREAARALADDLTRWAFGYAKLAGLVLAFAAAARFWAARGQGLGWWRVDRMRWGRFLLGMLGFLGLPSAIGPFQPMLDPLAFEIAMWVLTVVTLPFAFVMLSGLFGDGTIAIRRLLVRSWPWLPLLVVLAVAAFLPAQMLHGLLHDLAFGRPAPVVWALMTLDSLVVGLLAALVGAALFTAYERMAAALRPAA